MEEINNEIRVEEIKSLKLLAERELQKIEKLSQPVSIPAPL